MTKITYHEELSYSEVDVLKKSFFGEVRKCPKCEWAWFRGNDINNDDDCLHFHYIGNYEHNQDKDEVCHICKHELRVKDGYTTDGYEGYIVSTHIAKTLEHNKHDRYIRDQILRLSNENILLRELFGNEIQNKLRKKYRKEAKENMQTQRGIAVMDQKYARYKFRADLPQQIHNRRTITFWTFLGVLLLCGAIGGGFIGRMTFIPTMECGIDGATVLGTFIGLMVMMLVDLGIFAIHRTLTDNWSFHTRYWDEKRANEKEQQ